jgi:hypothetical protein
MKQEEQQFRFLVLLYAQLYSSVELMDEARAKPFIKGNTKRKLRIALESLEKDIEPQVNQLYADEEKMIFQNLQLALTENLKTTINSTIEEIVNEYYDDSEECNPT